MPTITDNLQGHAGLAVLIAWLLEWAKRSNLPFLKWISADSNKATLWASMALSALVCLGFQIQWEGTWDGVVGVMQHGGSFTVVVPSWDTIVQGFGQLPLNSAAYHMAVKPFVKPQGATA